MWNPFKKKDPTKAIKGVYYLSETFFPKLVDGFNSRFYEERIFEDINTWKQMLKNESDDIDFRFKEISVVGSGIKNNSDVYVVLIHWPDVKFPTSARACVIVIHRQSHKASQYVLESSFNGSMVVQITSYCRKNTGITIPEDENMYKRFLMVVIQEEGVLVK